LISEEPKTLQEIGDEFGVSRERVRQIEKRLQDKIKKYLTDELGENAFDV
jgi:RNA polymerase sigma-32 factor